MGFLVMTVLGHQTGAISPNQTPLEHARGGRSLRPPRLPAAQPPPVREAAMTARPVAPVIPTASPALLPAPRVAALTDGPVTIDMDTTDVEVYGRKKRGAAYNHQGQRVGRPHAAT